MPDTVSLAQMLDARERRAMRQWQLLQEYPVPLLCFTMNIAGPIKNSDLIREGFHLGCQLLSRQFIREKIPVLHFESIDEVTGNEACFCLEGDPLAIKQIAADIEDHTDLGRLFDMDLILPGGRKVDRCEIGLSERRCLICGGPAKECARSRTHSVPELQAKTTSMLEDGINRAHAQHCAELAVRALLYEVSTTPKPGLVDRMNPGSHRDMDIYSFLASSASLFPYFETCCRIGRETSQLTPEETFRALRWHGREAEGNMLYATGNVNTHKGAIFSLGILCGALGRLPRSQWSDSETILRLSAQMTEGLLESDFSGVTAENAKTVGQKLYAHYGITGVRGQAAAGFPAVKDVGLPVLERGLQNGFSLDRSGCAALLSMLCHATDTNMIARSDVETERAVAASLRKLLETDPYPDVRTLQELDRDFISRNLSPGGSADLLALCYFLHFLKEENHV